MDPHQQREEEQKNQSLNPRKLKTTILRRSELRYAATFLVLVISSVVVSRFTGAFDSHFAFRIAGFLSLKAPNSSEGCDYSSGRWVKDDRKFLQYDENCPFLDPGFRCRRNGRPDEGYLRWRWKPDGCDLPRFNAGDFLERSRNGRIIFAGDSIGRNQWESLLCMLSQAVTNKSTIYEVNGKPINKHKGFLSMKFLDHNVTVEYYRTPFLVAIGRPPGGAAGKVRRSIKVDKLHWYSRRWVGANVLVFNDGHWWNKGKTINTGCYFEENNTMNMTMDVMEAFKRSLQTWKTWAISNLDPHKTRTFFRSYSPVHYRNGSWNDGGNCDINVGPETDYETLEADHFNNAFIHDAIKQMKDRNIKFLNVTYLTAFRKDGHPSKYREPGTPTSAPQDCSHWCLPGIPDTWNELLYANLLSKGFRVK